MNRRGEFLFNFSLSAGKIAEEGLMVDILLRLPVKSLVRFKCVCKSWRVLISDPCFERAHHSRSTLVNPNSQRLLLAFERPGFVLKLLCCEITNSEATIEDENDLFEHSVKFKLPNPNGKCKIVGSCHGLVCLDIPESSCTDQTLVVLNPTTGAFKEIPTDNNPYVLGFGYDSAIDDYKVLAYALGGREGLKLVIFTMKQKEWRSVSTPQDPRPPLDVGFYANGCLHWPQFLYDFYSVGSRCNIFSFDLSTEILETIPMPADIDYKCFIQLVEFRGGLFFYSGEYDYDFRCQKCWIMEEHRSWTKVCDITCQSGDSETTVCCRTDAKALLTFYRGQDYTREDYFCLYSPKENKFTPFAPFSNPKLRWAHLYVESLVSP